MDQVGENFGSGRAEQVVRLSEFLHLVHEVPENFSDCVVVGHCSEVYQRASEQLQDEASSSNLQLLDLECDQQLVAESATLHPRPVLPPSEAIGVTYHKKNKQWEAHLWVRNRQLGKRKKKGTQIFLGNFSTQDEAKAAHDRAALKLDVRETAKGKPYPLNFPESAQSGYMAQHADWTPRDFVWKIRRFSHKFSKGRSAMKGVSVRSRKGQPAYYEAKISQTVADGEKRTFDLGKFACEETAGRAYDRALLFLKGGDSDCVTNFRPSGYSVAEVHEAGRLLLGTVSS